MPGANGSVAKSYARITGYDITGKISEIEYGNGVNTDYAYYASSKRLSGIGVSMPGQNADILDYTYFYHPSGNIDTILDNNNSRTYEYTYDNIHRLEKYKESQQSTDVIEYTYTPQGGISTRTVNGQVYDYSYEDNNVSNGGPHAVKMVRGIQYPFKTRVIDYNGDSMPTRIMDTYENQTIETRYMYDAANSRVRKQVISGGNSTTVDYINGSYEVSRVNGIIKKSCFIFAGNIRIGVIDDTGVYYFHQDHLGSLIAISKEGSPTSVQSRDAVYYPFGQLKENQNVHFDEVTNYTFTDQELDADTGLYNYNARLYDPAIGMFITADSIVPDWTNPQTLNRYSYCLNNPLSYTDPSGHFFQFVVAGAVIGAVASGAQNDWDLEATMMGALTGAISGAFTGWANGFISTYNGVGTALFGSGMSKLAEAGIYAGANGIAGAINASINDSNPGMGAIPFSGTINDSPSISSNIKY